MTAEFEYLFRLLGHAANGTEAVAPAQPLNWKRLLTLSNEQSVQALTLFKLAEAPCGFPEEGLRRILDHLRQGVLTAAMRRERILHLLEEMEQRGFSVAVIKGFAVAEVYAEPDLRLSGDTDLLIRQDQEKAILAFFQQKGFDIEPRNAHTHHALVRHPAVGMIELHIQLYDEIVEDIWFGRDTGKTSLFALKPFERHQTAFGSFPTLETTDHMLFLTMHMVKHFILHGFNLRMLADVTLFFRRWRDEIDTDRFWGVLDDLKYRTLIDTLFTAAVTYGLIAQDDIPQMCPADAGRVQAVLDDLEAGGFLGTNEADSRWQTWLLYNQQRFTGTEEEYQAYMRRWEMPPWKRRLYLVFPPSAYLIGHGYPWLARLPWLLPAAWVYRWFAQGIPRVWKRLTRQKPAQTDKPAAPVPTAAPVKDPADRMALFRSLDMLDE